MQSETCSEGINTQLDLSSSPTHNPLSFEVTLTKDLNAPPLYTSWHQQTGACVYFFEDLSRFLFSSHSRFALTAWQQNFKLTDGSLESITPQAALGKVLFVTPLANVQTGSV